MFVNVFSLRCALQSKDLQKNELKRSYDSQNVKYYLLLIEGRFHLNLIPF